MVAACRNPFLSAFFFSVKQKIIVSAESEAGKEVSIVVKEEGTLKRVLLMSRRKKAHFP